MNLSRVILKPGKEKSIRRFHPWVFSGAIRKVDGKIEEGDIVEVYSNKEKIPRYRSPPNWINNCPAI